MAVVEEVLYLDAWCHRAQADRVFRVDRIVKATVLDTPVLDPTFRPRDLTAGWFAEADTTRVTLRVAAPGRWMTEYYPVEDVRPGPDGSVEVDVMVTNEAWLRQLVFRLSPYATVVAPEEFAARIAASARSTLDRYDQHHQRLRRMDGSSS